MRIPMISKPVRRDISTNISNFTATERLAPSQQTIDVFAYDRCLRGGPDPYSLERASYCDCVYAEKKWWVSCWLKYLQERKLSPS